MFQRFLAVKIIKLNGELSSKPCLISQFVNYISTSLLVDRIYNIHTLLLSTNKDVENPRVDWFSRTFPWFIHMFCLFTLGYSISNKYQKNISYIHIYIYIIIYIWIRYIKYIKTTSYILFHPGFRLLQQATWRWCRRWTACQSQRHGRRRTERCAAAASWDDEQLRYLPSGYPIISMGDLQDPKMEVR